MFTTRPELRGTFGVVASTHWLASAVGMSILERGGNAFDAAGATAFPPQIRAPPLTRPGGGRQRLRGAGRPGLPPPDRRAAPQRAGRRGADAAVEPEERARRGHLRP